MFGNNRIAVQGKQAMIKPQASPTKDKNVILWRRMRKLRRGCFGQKSNGEKQEFRVMVVSHWLSCRDYSFLVGDAMYLSVSGRIIEDSFLLRILLFGVRNWQWVVCLHLPASPPGILSLLWLGFPLLIFTSIYKLQLLLMILDQLFKIQGRDSQFQALFPSVPRKPFWFNCYSSRFHHVLFPLWCELAHILE